MMGGQEITRAGQLPPLVPVVPGLVPSYPMGPATYGYGYGMTPPPAPWGNHPMIIHSGFPPAGMPWGMQQIPVQQHYAMQPVPMHAAPCAPPPPPVPPGPPKNNEESERAAGT